MRIAESSSRACRIVLAGRGSESRGRGCAADLVLVVHEALHPRFERRGDDLHTRVALPLLQALTGEAVTVPLLDGRALRVRARPPAGLQGCCSDTGLTKFWVRGLAPAATGASPGPRCWWVWILAACRSSVARR